QIRRVRYFPSHRPEPHPSPTRRSSDLFASELDRRPGVALGDEPRLEGERRPELPGDELQVGRGARVVELDQHLAGGDSAALGGRSEEHTSELQSLAYLVCRLLLEKKNM